MMDYYWLFGCLLCFAWGVFVTYMRMKEKLKDERRKLIQTHKDELANLEKVLKCQS